MLAPEACRPASWAAHLPQLQPEPSRGPSEFPGFSARIPHPAPRTAARDLTRSHSTNILGDRSGAEGCRRLPLPFPAGEAETGSRAGQWRGLRLPSPNTTSPPSQHLFLPISRLLLLTSHLPSSSPPLSLSPYPALSSSTSCLDPPHPSASSPPCLPPSPSPLPLPSSPSPSSPAGMSLSPRGSQWFPGTICFRTPSGSAPRGFCICPTPSGAGLLSASLMT